MFKPTPIYKYAIKRLKPYLYTAALIGFYFTMQSPVQTTILHVVESSLPVNVYQLKLFTGKSVHFSVQTHSIVLNNKYINTYFPFVKISFCTFFNNILFVVHLQKTW